MKQIITIAILIASTFTAFSQSYGYNDLGALWTQDKNYGTSRFNAMSGAFGALGGDVSAIGINPAGGVISRKSILSITLGNRNENINATYYGNTVNAQEDFFNISQAGGILSFDNNFDKSGWNRFAFTFNYRLKNDFDGFFSAQGNSGEALFNEHPNDKSTPINQFNTAQEQRFSNSTEGQTSVFSIGFSAIHENKLSVGGAINMHDIQMTQTTLLNETNSDTNNNILTASNEQYSHFSGAGVSVSLGFIYKAHHAFRFGLAYESPTWYQEIVEDSNLVVFDPTTNRYDDWVGHTIIKTDALGTINNYVEPNLSAFKLKTPSRITASTAFIFGKKGLLSMDFTHKGYKNTKFSNGNFNDANQNFSNDFKNIYAVNIGTEWRFDRMSLRGGYHYEQSPHKNALKDDNLKGFSLGLGYNFGNAKFDLAYKNSTNNNPYYIYNSPNIGEVNPIELTNNSTRITGTITFDL